MPETLGNSNLNLNLCFTKIKFPPLFSQSPTNPPPQIHGHDDDDDDDNHGGPSLSENNKNSTIIRNFNSLYEETAGQASPAEFCLTSAAAAAAFASRRFFCSTPGLSNSIVDSAGAPRREGDGDGEDVTLVGNSVAVPTMSPDPYSDFRRSMQEMLEARGGGNSNWEFLNELLLCYLALNPKSAHKFIIGAFSDLVVSLLPDRIDGLRDISG